ncbi:hypothetical protein ILUMI_03690 [Ignelater luminosus]|uniref:Craniofacial development protein 2-like n=1 Tax=Ignelater luminosus TaxID=2038154 RepID=A0A8K0DFS7_IGNLU|nr:hypothetical protein ILUMI_03690 [Ignelater luminosus]
MYAPSNDKMDEEVEEFYANVAEAMKITKKGEITIVLGNLNAKIGEGSDGELIKNDAIIRLYTWTFPRHTRENIIRNQIDYIMTSHYFKKFVKPVKTYSGTDIDSDHNPVVMDLKVQRFQKEQKGHRRQITKKIEIDKLKDQNTQTTIVENLENRMKDIRGPVTVQVESVWKDVKKAVIETQKQDIGYAKNEKKTRMNEFKNSY